MTLPGPAAAEGDSGREWGTCQSHKEACKRAERPGPHLQTWPVGCGLGVHLAVRAQCASGLRSSVLCPSHT